MAILNLCEKYFGTRDIYKLFELEKTAPPKDVKKAYYKLSLQVHPDRVADAEKEAATEKFKILSKLYQVLNDKDKRALYDEQGRIDDEDDFDSKLSSWLDLWRQIFKPISVQQIEDYEKNYIGSELERSDIKKAYVNWKGCINGMMNEVPFLQIRDEPRLQQIVGEMIAAGEVPEYKIFTKEPKQKRDRRHKKYEREFKEAEEIKKKIAAKNSSGSLEQAIMERQNTRAADFGSLMDRLMEKYGDEDDSDPIDVADLGKRSSKKKKQTPKKTAESPNLKGVKTGRVSKRKN